MERRELTIDTLLGKNNLLLVIPQAQPEENPDTHLAGMGRLLADRLGCYTVINDRYRATLVDMNDVRAVRKRKKLTDSFLVRIREFKEEITANNLLPLVLIIQENPGVSGRSADILIGYGQGERGRPDRPHRPTISPSRLSRIRMALEDQGLSTDLAPLDSDLCGRESYSLNQLFRQKDYVDGFYDPAVRSLVLTLAPHLLTTADQADRTASRLAEGLRSFADTMALVRKVATSAIDVASREDLSYIFRVYGDNRYNDMIRETYIDELAHSIKRNGLLHPLVLLQKKDGRYKILCGFRRFQAIGRLGWQWVEAKVYNEEDFTTEDFFNISLAENTKRRNLNPIEIGNFLESAAQSMGLNNARMADLFGETLGIGAPGNKVSQSTIHKYRKLNQIRQRGESAEMISDVINDKLPFSLAAEVLAPIKDPRDRDSLYLEVVKPLLPTRPQLQQIIKQLHAIDTSLHKAIQSPAVTKALEKAVESRQPASAFLRLLQQRKSPSKRGSDQEELEALAARMRGRIFGDKGKKQDLQLTRAGKTKRSGVTLHVRLRGNTARETLDNLRQLLADDDQINDLLKELQ